MPELAAPPAPEHPRILLVRMSAMGDIVFALPALALLRKLLPDARIEWLCEDRHQSLLSEHPAIDQLHIFPRKRGLMAALRNLKKLRASGEFDAIIDFQGNLKSAAHLWALKSARKIGHAKTLAREGAHLFVNEKVSVSPRLHRSLRDLSLVQQFLGEYQTDFNSIVHQAAPWPLTCQRAMPSCDVLLHTATTNYGKDKAWPIPFWVELAKRLQEAGREVNLLWTPAEHEQAEAIATAANCALAPSTNSLGELMQLCDGAKLLIGTDSGPLHLASLRGTKTIGLFGPTDPELYSSPGPNNKVISALPDGVAPPKRDRSQRSQLMNAIEVETVLAEAIRMLNG